MIIRAYLYVSSDGKLRMTKRNSGAAVNELALHVALDVPDSFFRRRIPEVAINVPDYFAHPSAEVTAKVIAPEVAEAMRLDVTAVEDGLLALVRQREGESDD